MALLVVCLSGKALGAITISIDYSLDSTGFFSDGDGAAKKAALEAARDVFEGIISDSIAAITPGGGNTWNAIGYHPGTGAAGNLATDLSVAVDTLIVFAGGRALSGSNLAQGGPGGWSGTGTVDFVDNLYNRGESGITNGSAVQLATQTDFAPWGGTITFDNDDVAWHYDHTTAVDAGKFDFYSAALHELAHAIGFGTAVAGEGIDGSWEALVSSGTFTGSHSRTSNGGSNVTLASGDGHWASGTTSLRLSDGVSQETAMDPDVTAGTRKYLTNLDAMGLADIGWQLNITAVPEPSTWALMSGIALLGFGAVRRCRLNPPGCKSSQ
ncbi:MAG: PEP-CTERM sorting domain-containing protein [Verrucomicrobiales bacterium]